MIQARIPEVILRELPVGAATAPLMRALREGATEGLPPALVAWVSRNGFDLGEPVELLPALVPLRPSDPAQAERGRRRGKRRLLLAGCGLLGLGLILPLVAGFLLARELREDPDTDIGLFNALLMGTVIWLIIQALPLFVLALATNQVTENSSLKVADFAGLGWLIVLWGLAYVSTVGGFALIARAKGLSPWLGFLGAISLCFRDRNRP